MDIKDIQEAVNKKQMEYEAYKLKVQLEKVFESIAEDTVRAIVERIEKEDVSAYDEYNYEICEARRNFQVEIPFGSRFGLTGIPFEELQKLQKHLINKGVCVSDATVRRDITSIKDGFGRDLFRFPEPAILTLSIDLNQFFN